MNNSNYHSERYYYDQLPVEGVVSALGSGDSYFVCLISAVLSNGRVEVVRNIEKTQTIVQVFV